MGKFVHQFEGTREIMHSVTTKIMTSLTFKYSQLFVDALEKHPLCHRMCKVTKETSGANNIMRNAIDSTSITFRWTSNSSQ